MGRAEAVSGFLCHCSEHGRVERHREVGFEARGEAGGSLGQVRGTSCSSTSRTSTQPLLSCVTWAVPCCESRPTCPGASGSRSWPTPRATLSRWPRLPEAPAAHMRVAPRRRPLRVMADSPPNHPRSRRRSPRCGYLRLSKRARSRDICCSRCFESASCVLTSSSRRTIRSFVAGLESEVHADRPGALR